MKVISSIDEKYIRIGGVTTAISVWRDIGDITIEDYFETIKDDLHIYDTDSGGDETYYFRFDNGNCYKFHHDFWFNYDPDWRMHNDFYIEEIELIKLPKSLQGVERDWLL